MQRSANVLAVFAHPDDETFSAGGVFAALSEAGHRVTLVCATRGEAGEISDPALATRDTLPEVREGELRTAMEIVGVSDVRLLDYRDSGMAGTPENDDPRAFIKADEAAVVLRLQEILRELQPAAVITFGADGIYGHPDHLLVYRVTTEAVRQEYAGAETGPALYYHAISRERVMARAKRGNNVFSRMSAEELAKFGVPEAEITTAVDVSPFVERKRAAMAAHRTQFPPDGPFSDEPVEDIRRFLSTERFIRVPLPWDTAPNDPLLELVGATVAR